MITFARRIDAEAMLAAGGVEDDAVLSVLLHMPFVDHLVQELRRDLALVGFILQ